MVASRLFLLALILSLCIHGVFLYYSYRWEVSDVQRVEEKVETLFKVNMRDLESENFVSRPNQQQMQEERSRALQEQMQQIARNASEAAEAELAARTAMAFDPNAMPLPDTPPSLSEAGGNAGAESESGAGMSGSDPFFPDQTAENLITSDISERAVEDFEKVAAANAVQDRAASNKRIPLAGRGQGTQNRIMANLPSPAQRTDPVVSRSIGSVLNRVLVPDAPVMDIAQPPIDLPPVNEILPSPNLLRPSMNPTSLKKEEEAIKEIQDRYVQLDDLLDVQLFTYHHLGGEGYFMIQIRPIAQDDRLRVLPKDVVFVLDASGSMGSRRIDTIKSEIKGLIQRLRPEDRFNVVGFKQDIKKYTRTLAPATDEFKRAAWQFLSPLEASGRTDIYASLQPLVQLGTERARPLVMLLYSDGRPTMGVVDSRKIINNLAMFRGPSTSIFCVGTGDKLNRYLLDMLAFRNRGMVAFEQDRSDLPSVMQSVFGYIEDPVLLKVQANFEGVDMNEVYPKKLPDLYLKGELKIWGRMKNESNISVRIVGEAFDEKKEMIKQLPIPEMDNATYEIARQWAFHKAYDLIGRMVEEGEKPELIEEIRNISRTYRIGTPYSEEVGIK